jgi:hypothetical protein
MDHLLKWKRIQYVNTIHPKNSVPEILDDWWHSTLESPSGLGADLPVHIPKLRICKENIKTSP